MRCESAALFLVLALSCAPIGGQYDGVKVVYKPSCSLEEESKDGDMVVIEFKGAFDGEPFPEGVDIDEIKLGTGAGGGFGDLGFELGVKGMCVGERRELRVPPDLRLPAVVDGEGVPLAIVYEVVLLEIDRKGPKPNIFAEIDTNGDAVLHRDELQAWHLKSYDSSAITDVTLKWARMAAAEDDRDMDGLVTWEEFSGPKGDRKPEPRGPGATPEPRGLGGQHDEL